jgi:CheY-like chemotaxis protein
MTVGRLMLVDDDPDGLDLFALLLSRRYRVFPYRSSSEALDGLAVAAPDLLVLDIGLGPANGVQCLHAIRAVPGYGTIPAIALTGYARDTERKAFLDAGFQIVVTKPVLDHAAFLETIDAWLPSQAAARIRGSSARDQAPSWPALDRRDSMARY